MNLATKLKISKSVHQQILEAFNLKQEDGGILGIKDGVISSFCFDQGNDHDAYTINVIKFSEQLEKWEKEGIAFAGFIHSHVVGEIGEPSIRDFTYVKKFMSKNDWLEELLFPIVYQKDDQKVIQFYLFKNNEFNKLDYIVV